eukprot:m.32266 g.32266  ORF g.32266 m.32266 type:complete len:177 (-) comp9769_c1_seq1:146-676(-)
MEDLRGVGVAVTTVTGEVIKGVVFSYTPDSTQEGNGFLTITQKSESKDPRTSDFRMIRTGFIKDCVADESVQKGVKLQTASYVSLVEQFSKEKKYVNQAKQDANSQREGVSKRAQNVFDTLARQMECHWEGTDIIVNGKVRIKDPYTEDSCEKCEGGNNKALSHVKNILSDIKDNS